jgi:fumarate reductase subunit D
MTTAVMAWAGQVRHLMSGLGGLLVGLGWATQDELGTLLAQFEAVVGAVFLLGAHSWSLWEKARMRRSGETVE